MADNANQSAACDTGNCTISSPDIASRFSLWDAAVLGGILVAMLYGIGTYGLYEPHEGHFAGVGREMVLGHDWVTPRLNGAPYLNKPPLFYWMIAASYSVFGFNEWAARLPQALIGWLGVLLAWWWARELWGARAGRAAAGILGVSAGWYLFSHQLLIDELLSVLHLASLYFLWKGLISRGRGYGWTGFYVTLGISVMAKGLIGLVMPLAVALAFRIFRRFREILGRSSSVGSTPRIGVVLSAFWTALGGCFKRTAADSGIDSSHGSRPWRGVLIILALVAPWVLLVELRNPGFLHYVIVNEHILRLFNRRWPPDYVASKTTWYNFLLIAAVWLAPWCLFLPQIVTFSAKKALGESSAERDKTDGIAVLALGALLPTLLFVPVPSRLIYYSLPTLPPFAVLAAGWWAVVGTDCYRRGRLAAAWVALVAGVGIATAGQVIGSLLTRVSDLQAAPQTLQFMPGFALSIGAGLVLCGAFLLGRKTSLALVGLCLPIALGQALNTAGFAAFDRVRSSKRMVAELGPKLGVDAIWVSEGSLEIGSAGGTAFYLGTDDQGNARFEYVMESDSPYRRPPRFPGQPPQYLIDDMELDFLWRSNRAVVYVTDFLRTPGRKDDPINLPPEPRLELKVDGSGHRHIFANPAAKARLEK